MSETKVKRNDARRALKLATRLVAAWKGESTEHEDEIFDLIMYTPRPRSVFISAFNAVNQEDGILFRKKVFFHAGNLFPNISLPDNEEFITSFNLFTIVLSGPEHEIDRMMDSEILDRLAQELRKCGLVHNEANVAICALPIDIMTAAKADPYEVRSAAEVLLASTMDPDPEDPKFEIGRIFPQVERHQNNEIHIVTRILVGGRLMPKSNRSEFDFLGSPPIPDGIRAQSEYEQCFHPAYLTHFEARENARNMFAAAANKIVEEAGYLVIIDGIYTWNDNFIPMVMHRLFSLLQFECFASGLASPLDPDMTHFAMDAKGFHAAIQFGTTIVGPVSIPVSAGIYALEPLLEWAQSSGKFEVHQNLEAVRRLRGREN